MASTDIEVGSMAARRSKSDKPDGKVTSNIEEKK
jgi:hypothetical protein